MKDEKKPLISHHQFLKILIVIRYLSLHIHYIDQVKLHLVEEPKKKRNRQKMGSKNSKTNKTFRVERLNVEFFFCHCFVLN